MNPRSPALGREVPGWLSASLVLGALGVILVLEVVRPLRRTQRESKLRRDTRNLAMSALSAAAIRYTEKPLTAPLTKRVQEGRLGLLPKLELHPAVEVAAAVLLLDYTLYLWHVLTHKVPFLWRFHRVHHADLDLTTTTAARFHFMEMMLSAPWRAAQVALIGASPRSLTLWQTLTTAAILFHHSNVRLPLALERLLCRVLVTPRMHGIHHSIVERETDSNWATIFSWPDYAHRTIRLNVPQAVIDIGVPQYRDASKLGLGRLLGMPFERHRPWRLYGEGPEPQRTLPLARSEDQLAA
jgi:sterol desaturase/sphingolipid hydroxylase (fatty acid hydroxylase superfamily)